MGFKRDIKCPCIYWHPGRDLRLFVHGDDFVTVGGSSDVERFRGTMDGYSECKHALMAGVGDTLTILTRTVTRTDEGLYTKRIRGMWWNQYEA